MQMANVNDALDHLMQMANTMRQGKGLASVRSEGVSLSGTAGSRREEVTPPGLRVGRPAPSDSDTKVYEP